MSLFEIASDPIDLDTFRASLSNVSCGACVVFEGWVRDHNEGRRVLHLAYEVYEKLTVVKDPATGVYWDWKKAKLHSADEAFEKGYSSVKKSYKAYLGQDIDGVVYSGFKPDKINKSGSWNCTPSSWRPKVLTPCQAG